MNGKWSIHKSFLIDSVGLSCYVLPYLEISFNYGESFWLEIGWLFFRLCISKTNW
jgi:hypothetical protein